MNKTYAINGLIDWQASLPVGRNRLEVHFSGGALTKYGVVPAKYSTSNPIVQHIIENSDLYKSRRIYLLRK